MEVLMDWKIFFITFFSVFAAELADKTQLVGMGMAAKTGKPFSVLFASVSAFFIVTLITVFVGVALGKYLKPELIRVSGASIFILIGVLMLARVI